MTEAVWLDGPTRRLRGDRPAAVLRLFLVRAEPRIVGRYAIHGEIASGGMASVHIARLTEASGAVRTVAIKRTHPHLAREPDFALMFLDEARVASRIQHPNVVATLEVLGTAEELALVMDYVHGESVWKLVRAAKERGEPVPVAIAASILVGTLHGLHAAHEATDERGAPLRIVHRDVSPQNILVGTDGVARLVDFGIAKAAGRLHSTHDSSVKGKYAYMAPEQVRGEAVSRLTDTYAAAIVFWELLTGERLFAGKTEAETIHKCLVGRVQPPSLFAPGIGPELAAIVSRALTREPARRYQSALELATDIEACVPPIDVADVGAWVQRMAGESLAAREHMLAEIERGEREDRQTPTGAAGATPAPTIGTRAPRRSRTAATLFAIAAVALVAAGASTVAARRRTPDATDAVPATPWPATTASAVATDLAPPLPAPSSAPPSATPGASAQAIPPPTSAPAARPAPHTAPRPSHPRRPSCDPPYSIDAQGRQIFKPECM